MTLEEFAAAVEKLIAEARDAGISNDDIISELESIIDGMDSEPESESE